MKKNLKKNKTGQATVELVLILTIMIAGAYFALNKFQESRDSNPFYQFVSKPWKSIAGMMEAGTWIPCDSSDCDEARKKHPNYWSRMKTDEGENI